MIQTEVTFELNHTFIILSGDGIKLDEDYRHKMLSSNSIPGTLKTQFRQINNERKMYFDITNLESLLNHFASRTINRNEVKNLFQAIYLVAGTLTQYLVEEGNILLRPDLIFRNVTTGKYEFICVPVVREEEEGRDNIKNLISFIMTRLDNSDEKLVNSIYGLYDMQEFGRVCYKSLYEIVVDAFRDETYYVNDVLNNIEDIGINKANEDIERKNTIKKDIKDEVIKKSKTKFLFSKKELLVMVIGVVGICLIGLHLYYVFT